MDDESGDDEVNRGKIGEVDEMNLDADSTDDLMHIERSDLCCSLRIWLADEKE